MTSDNEVHASEDDMLKIALDKNRGPIILALFDNPRKITLDVDELLFYVNNDVSRLYPTIEKMVEEGLIIRGIKEKQEKGKKSGIIRTYSLADCFYKELFLYNKENKKILQKLAQITFR